ncbi:phosphoglucomutase, partial [Staphylococcus chromogenes]
IDVLTGFKYISDQLHQHESLNDKLVLAYEESHGYLLQDFSRDKDAIQCIPLLIKYKQLFHQKGTTLFNVLEDIYQQVGRYEDKTLSPKYEGQNGQEKIKTLMSEFRNFEASTLCGLTLSTIEDYQTSTIYHFDTDETTKMNFPVSDVIRFTFEEGFIAMRPSGTEPKMKIYFSLKVPDFEAIVGEFQETYL